MPAPATQERRASPTNPEVLTITELTPAHVKEIATRTGGDFRFSFDGNYDGQASVTYPDGVISFGTHLRDGQHRANGWSANLEPNNRRKACRQLRDTALVLGPDGSVRFVGTPDALQRSVPVITVTGGKPFYQEGSLPYEQADPAVRRAALRLMGRAAEDRTT